ncbi:MFS transporter [Streptomyces sp. NPDC048211]|uniref:MFS transporter n=1 Tax=Streptomyces sp. NPDC048211 TaxID=3365516 RepID=UPI003724A958
MPMPQPRQVSPPKGARVPPPDETGRRRRAWLIAALIVTFMLINYADKAVLGLAAVPIMDELQLSNSAYGLIASSFAVLFSLSGFLAGFFSSRISSRVMLFVMALLWAVAQVPVLLVASVPALVAGRVLLGAAEGPATPMSMHALYKWFPEGRRGLPSALQISGAALGTLIAAPVLTGLITGFGWRSGFAALAVTSVVWSLVWWKLGHDGPYDQRPAPKRGAPREPAPEQGTAVQPAKVAGLPYRRLLTTGTMLGSMVGAFGGSWANALSQAWLPAYLRTELGLAPGRAATVISIVAGLGFVLLLAVSPVVDALNRRGVSMRWSSGALQGAAVTMAGLAMAAVPLVEGRGATLVLVAVAFSVFALVFPLHYVTAAAVVPPSQRGAVFGIVAGTGTLPILIAPYLTGHFLDTASSRSAGYLHAFLVSGAVMLVCGIFAMVTIRPERDARRLGLTPAAPAPTQATAH